MRDWNGRGPLGVLSAFPGLACKDLVKVRGKQLGHFEHGDLVFTKYRFELRVGVDVALIRSVLQVVRLDVFPYFLRHFRTRKGPLPMTAASSSEGMGGLLKPVAAAVFAAGDFLAAVAMNYPFK